MASKKVKTEREENLTPIKVGFGQDEEWLGKYMHSHSSPSSWLKDLAIKEYNKEQREQLQNERSTILPTSSSMFDSLDD